MSRRKKVLIAAGVFFGCFVAAVGSLYLTTFAGMMPLPATSQLSSGIVIVNEGYVASYIVPLGGGNAVVVDCGLAADAGAIKAELASRQLQLVAALVTHGHPDHVGGCNALGAPVVALAAEVPGIWGDVEFYRGPVPRLAGPHGLHVKVQRPLEDGVTITFPGANARVFAVPGHTRGSAVYVINGVAFFGDTASANDDGSIRGPPAIFSDDRALGVKWLHILAE